MRCVRGSTVCSVQTKEYEAELAVLNQAFALGAIKGPMAQARALDELNAKYASTTGTVDALTAAQQANAASAKAQADAWQTLASPSPPSIPN